MKGDKIVRENTSSSVIWDGTRVSKMEYTEDSTSGKAYPTAKRDNANKVDYTLIPWEAMPEVIKAFEQGERDYGRDNYKLGSGLTLASYRASMFRHLVASQNGVELDEKSGANHIAHLVANGLMYLWQKQYENQPRDTIGPACDEIDPYIEEDFSGQKEFDFQYSFGVAFVLGDSNMDVSKLCDAGTFMYETIYDALLNRAREKAIKEDVYAIKVPKFHTAYNATHKFWYLEHPCKILGKVIIDNAKGRASLSSDQKARTLPFNLFELSDRNLIFNF